MHSFKAIHDARRTRFPHHSRLHGHALVARAIQSAAAQSAAPPAAQLASPAATRPHTPGAVPPSRVAGRQQRPTGAPAWKARGEENRAIAGDRGTKEERSGAVSSVAVEGVDVGTIETRGQREGGEAMTRSALEDANVPPAPRLKPIRTESSDFELVDLAGEALAFDGTPLSTSFRLDEEHDDWELLSYDEEAELGVAGGAAVVAVAA
ncbi:hypothetical protein JCM10207_006463 [Rhodosporidiobolus poonsookiae]